MASFGMVFEEQGNSINIWILHPLEIKIRDNLGAQMLIYKCAYINNFSQIIVSHDIHPDLV